MGSAEGGPDFFFAEVIELFRIGYAYRWMFAQAGGEPGSACFGCAYPDKIEFDGIVVQIGAFVCFGSETVKARRRASRLGRRRKLYRPL